jgi:hypothetical protein
VNFSEQPPSKQWAALKFRGEKFAEVWFKPENDPLAVTFRIPRSSFQLPGMGQRLTTENLLKAVAIPADHVEFWRQRVAAPVPGGSPGGLAVVPGGSPGGLISLDESNPELRNPLPEPPPDVDHLEIYVRLKPEPQAVAGTDSSERDTAPAKWQDLETRWKAILGLEATLDTLRINVEALRAELEASWKRMLTAEEKLHALSADVVQWNKAKSRVHYALPKTKEFIHRATWAKGTPERKRLDELFKDPLGTPIPLEEMDKVMEELEIVRKDRQALSSQGMAVYQECKGISVDIQGALRRLQNNAAARALKKKGATRDKLF